MASVASPLPKRLFIVRFQQHKCKTIVEEVLKDFIETAPHIKHKFNSQAIYILLNDRVIRNLLQDFERYIRRLYPSTPRQSFMSITQIMEYGNFELNDTKYNDDSGYLEGVYGSQMIEVTVSEEELEPLLKIPSKPAGFLTVQLLKGTKKQKTRNNLIMEYLEMFNPIVRDSIWLEDNSIHYIGGSTRFLVNLEKILEKAYAIVHRYKLNRNEDYYENHTPYTHVYTLNTCYYHKNIVDGMPNYE